MKIKEIIDKLNSIDVKEFKNIDLSKIDTTRIFNNIKRNPYPAIIIVIIFGTIVFSFNVFSNFSRAINENKIEITELKHKLDKFNELERIKSELKTFKSNIPEKMNSEELINKITDFAINRKIQITTFEPAREQDNDLYTLVSIHLNIVANTFSDAWLFVHDIEQNEFALRIDKWLSTSTNEKIQIRLLISAVNLKVDTLK